MILLECFQATLALHLPLREKLRWFRSLVRYSRNIRAFRTSSSSTKKVTAIILAYGRPRNIPLILRMLLKLPQIGRVIISNNNPQIELQISISDPRVVLLRQPVRKQTQLRYDLALQDDADEFLFIDDDIFLDAEQVETLLQKLHENPSVPHGLIGQIYDPWLDRMHHNVLDHEGQLDILNCVYALHKSHVAEFFHLTEKLNITPSSPFWGRSVYDDILLSFSGSSKPLCHRVGPLLLCPSTRSSMAACSEDEFFDVRRKIFLRLRDIKNFK